MVSFKVPKKTTMVPEYLDDPKSKETQDRIPLWETPKVSPESSCETTPLFIPPSENFKSSSNSDQVKIFCPPPLYSSACQHIPSFSNFPYVPEIGESSTPTTSNNREDNTISLSLLSLSCNVREVL